MKPLYVCLSFKREITNSIKVSIAAYLGCSAATISRELSRNKTKTGIYNSKTAQELANERKERFSKKWVFNPQKKSFVIHAIKEDNCSAEQIVGYVERIIYLW